MFVGLDKYLGTNNDFTIGYLKDFVPATASNGAVIYQSQISYAGSLLWNLENLCLPNAKEYIIDDAELERVYREYPIMWKDKNKEG